MSSDVLVADRWRSRAPASTRAAARSRDGERLAVGAVVIAIALLPLLRPSGPANTAPVDALMGLALFAALLWAGRSRRRIRLPYALPLALVLVGGALGALAGPVSGQGVVALAQDMTLLLWFWAIVNVGSSLLRLQAFLRAWAYAATGWAVVLLGSVAAGVTAVSGQTESEGVRTALTFGNPNLAGNYFFISIIVVWASARPRQPALRLAAYVLLWLALLSTGSNSALVITIVGAAVASLFGIYRRAGLVPAVTALAAIALAVGVLAANVSIRDLQSSASRSSYAFVRDGLGRSAKTASDRELLLRQGIALYQTGGPLGSGPASTKVRLDDATAHRAVEAHNDYVAAINERGVVGFVGMVLLVAGVAFQALRLATASPSSVVARAIVRPNALVGAVAGTAVAMTTTEYLHVRHVWTLFALVVAGSWLARE